MFGDVDSVLPDPRAVLNKKRLQFSKSNLGAVEERAICQPLMIDR